MSSFERSPFAIPTAAVLLTACACVRAAAGERPRPHLPPEAGSKARASRRARGRLYKSPIGAAFSRTARSST